MIPATAVIGIDVSRDWLDGFCVSSGQHFRLPNTAEGHVQLLAWIQQLPDAVRIGFEATGGQEWALWAYLVAAGIEAVQLAPAQIKAFARSRGTRAKTGRIDAVLIAGFMQFRPEAGRILPHGNLRILRALTTRRAQIVDMRKRLAAQICAREKQGVADDLQELDSTLKAVLDGQVSEIEQRIERVITQEESLAKKARLLRSIPGIGPVSAAMLIAEMPQLGRMTAGEAAAMTGLAPVSHDSGARRGRRTIAGGRRSLRHVLFQAALAAACHNPLLKPLATRMKESGKPHKLIIIAGARRLVVTANTVLKTATPWQTGKAA